ncbi:hypothetical protein UFOVP100_55, partial [uncultured Caudovirales phage]
MSDWELSSSSNSQKIPEESQWELSSLNPSENEGFGQSLKNAPGKIAQDIGKAINHGIDVLPQYWEKAKTEVPAFLNPLNKIRHPIESGKQFLGGLLELGEGINHAPYNIAQYAANRLNLIPQEWANKVPQASSLNEDIEKYIGQPKNPGDALIRGLGRNSLGLIPGAEAASLINPMRLTNSGIARNVV